MQGDICAITLICRTIGADRGRAARGRPRAEDRRVLSGIIRVLQRGLQWRDAPARRRPVKTLYNRYVRWSRARVFALCFAATTIAAIVSFWL